MPKQLDYQLQKEDGYEIVVIDERPSAERVFRKTVDVDITHYYGDDSFDVTLTEILRNHLAANYSSDEHSLEITIQRIELASSINGGGGVDEDAYETAVNAADTSDPGGAAGAILARPLTGAIEHNTSRRTIWCRIDYVIDGQDGTERTVSSARPGGLSERIVQLYLETIDNIGKKKLRAHE